MLVSPAAATRWLPVARTVLARVPEDAPACPEINPTRREWPNLFPVAKIALVCLLDPGTLLLHPKTGSAPARCMEAAPNDGNHQPLR